MREFSITIWQLVTNLVIMLRNTSLLWLVILFIVSCRLDKNPSYLHGPWVIIKGPNNTGRIWDIRKDKLIVKVLGTDYIEEYKCKITYGDKLIFEYETGEVESDKIVSGSKDSLVLMDQDSNFIKLVPLLKSEIDLSLEQLSKLFINSSWHFKSGIGEFRFDFTDQHRHADSTQPRWALSHGMEEWSSKYSEVWTIDEYNGRLFLLHTNYEVELVINMLKAFDGNQMKAVAYWWDGRPFDLTMMKTKKLPDSERVEIIEQLSSGTWKLQKYDTTFLHRSRSFHRNSSKPDSLLTISELNTNKVIYHFKANGDFIQEAGNDIIETSNWTLSSDGKFIWIGGHPTPNCIELVSIDSNKLTIRRMEGILGLGAQLGSLRPPSGTIVPFFNLTQDLKMEVLKE